MHQNDVLFLLNDDKMNPKYVKIGRNDGELEKNNDEIKQNDSEFYKNIETCFEDEKGADSKAVISYLKDE